MMYINVPSKSTSKNTWKKKILLKVSDPHPYQNFMDPQHCDTMRAFLSTREKNSPGSSLHAINSATLLAAAPAGFIITPALKIRTNFFTAKIFHPRTGVGLPDDGLMESTASGLLSTVINSEHTAHRERHKSANSN
jgi:hypothetical protein